MQAHSTHRITRREAISRLGLAGLALATDKFLVACAHTPRRSPIDWQPSIALPVQAGYVDLARDQGAPVPMRLFYPSLSHPPSAQMLPPMYPYPLVLFLHGQCPGEADHYQRWYYLPYKLACCGYVVAVPDLPSIRAGALPEREHPDLRVALRTLEFLRSGWEHADLLQGPPATGIVGHSYGAALGAYLIERDAEAYSAFVSLSGTFELGDMSSLLPRITLPGFYLAGTGNRTTAPEAYRRDVMQAFWRHVVVPKHQAIVEDAEHWDFLDLANGGTACRRVAGEEIRGSCREAGRVAVDLIAVFLAKYVVNPLTAGYAVGIRDSLVYQPPPPPTREQRLLASSHLRYLERISSGHMPESCRVELAWETRRQTGSRSLP